MEDRNARPFSRPWAARGEKGHHFGDFVLYGGRSRRGRRALPSSECRVRDPPVPEEVYPTCLPWQGGRPRVDPRPDAAGGRGPGRDFDGRRVSWGWPGGSGAEERANKGGVTEVSLDTIHTVTGPPRNGAPRTPPTPTPKDTQRVVGRCGDRVSGPSVDRRGFRKWALVPNPSLLRFPGETGW